MILRVVFAVYVAGLVAALLTVGSQWWDRLPVTPIDRNNIRECITASSWRVRFKIADCAIVTTTAIGLTAVSLVLAAPASATDPHGTDGSVNHTATNASQERDESVGGSSQLSGHGGVDNVGKVATDPFIGEPVTAAEPDTADPEASEVWLPGHDKCKRHKGNMRLLPWCTDPAAGWIGSTTHRAENNPAIPKGI